jgi:outer membrane receptor protein involved in Fe transport
MAYAAQRYTGTNPASLASVAEGTRTAGAVFAFDTWTLSRRATLIYGGRVARYGYVEKALFSPRARLDIAASDHLRISVGAARRAEAPGAEEFVPSSVSETWLPPERTFAPLVGTRFRPERTHTYEVAIAQDLGTEAVLGLRTFYQRTEDQVATLFGLIMLLHQVGGFAGVWLGGLAAETAHGYRTLWLLDIALALVAAAIYLPVHRGSELGRATTLPTTEAA